VTTHVKSAMVVCIALVSFAAQPFGQAAPPPSGQTATTPSGQTSKPAAGQASTARPGSVALTVVTESGATLSGAAVSLRGAVDRQALAGTDGVATLLNIPPGTYRARISRDGYVTFEKEVTIRAGVRATSEAALTAAPAAPPPPPPAPKETPKPSPSQSQSESRGPVGAAKVLSLTDLAEQMLNDKAPLVEREIGCSVATASQLILVRETLTSHTHADADEMLYVVAGDATLKIADKDTQVSAGWFGIVPRGSAHSLAKRGRNAPIVLAIRSGQPCGG
jgi:mannose-6-phosphate isomerase-like protein (cupin superfamily)